MRPVETPTGCPLGGCLNANEPAMITAKSNLIDIRPEGTRSVSLRGALNNNTCESA